MGEENGNRVATVYGAVLQFDKGSMALGVVERLAGAGCIVIFGVD